MLALRELYRRIPTVNCQRLCGHACRTVIDMSHTERERIETVTGQPLPDWMATTVNRVCPLLDPGGGCSAYGVRPTVCRVWGATDTPGMVCPHGCTIEGEPLTALEAELLILEAYRVGGSAYDTDELAAFQAVLADARTDSDSDLGPLLDRFIAGDHSPEVLNGLTATIHTGLTRTTPAEPPHPR